MNIPADNYFKIVPLMEFYDKNHQILSSPNRLDYYIILWIKAGRISIDLDSVPTSIMEESIIYIGRNRLWSIKEMNTCEGYAITFTTDFFCRTASDSRFINRSLVFDSVTDPFIRIAKNVSAKNILQYLLTEYLENEEFCNDIIRFQLSTLILLSEREINKRNVNAYAKQEDFKLTRIFRQLIEQQYKEIKSISKYADLMAISSKRLTEAVKNTTGFTPKRLLNDRIILEAKRLLVYCSWNIKEIGFHLGFMEETNFTKFFKQQTKITPLEFRNSDHPFK